MKLRIKGDGLKFQVVVVLCFKRDVGEFVIKVQSRRHLYVFTRIYEVCDLLPLIFSYRI